MNASLDRLARVLGGAIVFPGAPAYDEARQVFNLARQGRPAAIVAVADAADVEVVVRLARDEGWPLAVRAGGHSIGGFSAAEGAVVIDLRRMSEVVVDGDIVSVGGGCTWGALLAALEPHDLAIPGAFDTRVGVAGLTLGGGYGILSRALGLASDNLIGADVVTATGERVATEDHPELLWALRGAGANFGVVTRFRFPAHAMKRVVAGSVLIPLAEAREVLPAVRDLAAGLPDATTINIGINTQAAGIGLLALVGYHVGPIAEARRWLEPLTRMGQPVHAQFGEIAYRAAHGVGESFPDGHANAWSADFVRRLDDDVLDVIAEHALSARGEDLWIVLEHLGGAVGRIPASATAFPHRDAGFGIVSTVKWRLERRPVGQPSQAGDRAIMGALDAPAPARVLAVQARMHEALAPRSIGRYVNYVSRVDNEDDLVAAYGANLPRLRELKRRWDPDNVFRHNVNLIRQA